VPLYEYECTKCHHRFERIQKFSDPTPACPKCKGKLEQLLHAPAVQFKGSGWYVTDYARASSGSSSANSSKEDGAGKSEEKTEAKSDTKSESKKDTESKPKTAKKRKE
jgi:putative FmdB family regulatory protein